MDQSSISSHSIICIVGARPNFMKIAPIMAALKKFEPTLDVSLVHTGQHYDVAMNEQYFQALGIPNPDINLEVGSGTHATQTAEVMCRFEAAIEGKTPTAILVVGDVNSTIACALVATKKGIPVIHVEAGLRSFDRAMPEEINRVLTDQISDMLFTTEPSGKENLLREGIADHRIHFVGNVMIDTLRHNLTRAIPPQKIASDIGRADFFTDDARYAVVTMHRPSNVDDELVLKSLLQTIVTISTQLPVVFPLHPRTKGMIHQFGLDKLLDTTNILLLPPMGYLEMLGLMQGAMVVLTDSGGIQEETTALGVPCITLRNNTERPITITEGTNTIAGQDPEKILAILQDVLRTGGKAGRIPEYWDGHASDRIADVIATKFGIHKTTIS
jgi:UDP-N-acetylglucosamine 2-epimerase (non-hydrolysing)